MRLNNERGRKDTNNKLISPFASESQRECRGPQVDTFLIKNLFEANLRFHKLIKSVAVD